MAGTLVLDTLQNGAGTASTSADNVINGSAKAWVKFNGTTSPGTIRASYNVSSVTRNSLGNFTVNFTNALADTNYAYVGVGRRNDATHRPNVLSQPSSAAYDPTTTSLRFIVWCDAAASEENPLTFSLAIYR